MKKTMWLALAIISVVGMVACNAASSNEPKNVAKSFFEALTKKDYDEAAKYATNDSKAALDLVKSLSSMGEGFMNTLNVDSLEKAEKQPNIEYGDAIIEGDLARVPLTVDGKTSDIRLRKEDGAWKVAFDKETIKQTAAEEAGKSVDEMNAGLDSAMKEINNIDIDSLNAAMKQMQQVLGSDTLKKALNDAGEVLNKLGDALKEASKEKQQ